MKKWLSILLVLTLLLTTAACAAPAKEAETAPAAPAETAAPEATSAPAETPAPEAAPVKEPVPLPGMGDVVEGFAVKEIRDLPLVGATTVLFEHEKTGAELMYIANSDTNRVFDLTFFTRAIDNTGLPHVFEHSTLSGSDKYPSKSLFFNLSYQTYNTFMNAFTYPLMTSYPVASLSEEQLLRYADFYTDSCLHPSILKDESIYREEAWRYRMADADDDLTIEGTVYSEMLAAMDLESWASANALRMAFPGSTIGNISGGDPDYIPNMTWDSLKAYHDLYYHPSNCIAYLYGQFEDYTAFLKLLDEAFAGYDRQEFTFEDADYTPITSPAEESFPFPVEAGSGTENRSVVYYEIICPGLKEDLDEEMVLNTLTDLLVADASPLMQKLKDVLPSGSFATYIETEGPEDAITFIAQNVNPEDAELFRDTVDEVLADVAENGFAQDLVDGLAASLSLSVKLTRESSSVGVDLIPSIAYSYSSSGDPFNYLDYVDALENLDDWNQKGLYKDAVAKWLIGSETTVLCTTYPQPGLREELDANQAERLAAVKAGMSEEELQAVIDASNAPQEDDDASEYIAQLQAVTVASLPEEEREYAITDETGEDGVRRLTAAADVDAVGQTAVLLDASGIPQEDVHWFALYVSMMGDLHPSAHSREELATLTTRYLYGGEIRLSLRSAPGSEEYTPYLRAGWIAADEDLAAGYELLYELLYDTQFTDTETLQGLIGQYKASLKSDITNSPYAAMLYRSLGAAAPLYAYYDNYYYLNHYSFLEEVEQAMAEDPEQVTEKLEEIRDYFHNRTGAVALYAGSEEGAAVNAPLQDAFLDKLDAREVESVAYSFPAPAKSEALILDSSVQYNAITAGFADLGLEEYTADLDALAALVDDAYLLPQLRDQYGVYTPWHSFIDDAGVYLLTYRDPNVTETFAVYEALPEFLAGMDLDQETLDGYILASYSQYAMPEGELSGAVSAMLDVLNDVPAGQKIEYMQQLKSLTPEKVAGYVSLYEKLIENGLRFTAGGAAAVNANEELYEVVFNPFGSVDTSQVELTDVPEGHEHYEAVRFVYENMLMGLAGENTFGVDDDATAGELAGALYALIGGDVSAQDEALELFAEYGIVPRKMKAADPLTGAQAQDVLASFSEAVEVDFTPDAGVSADTLTRGELAEVIMAYTLPLM